MDEKQQLRAAMRMARRDYARSLPREIGRLILHRPPQPLVNLLAPGQFVGLYHAIGAEAPTRGWIRWFHENGYPVALPWFADRDAPMQFRQWTDPWDETQLEPGPYGGMQPGQGSQPVDPDVLIVPLIAFTAGGERLGQGGGHYDRYLAAHPHVDAIGLAWDMQRVDSLPVEHHDHPLSAVVTPSQIYWSKTDA